MTKQSEKPKCDEITEAKEGFLKTSSLEDIHYGDPFFFESIILWHIRPTRLLADALDNLLADDNLEGAPLLLNEVQKKLDELIRHCEKWDKEEREMKDKKVPRPIRQELLRLEGYLESVPAELQHARASFETLKPLLAALENGKAPDTESSHKDSAGA